MSDQSAAVNNTLHTAAADVATPAAAASAKAFINMPLPELYQRRLVMLRELNALEDAIKSLEAQQTNQTAAMAGSLAAAIADRLKAMGEAGTHLNASSDNNTIHSTGADDRHDTPQHTGAVADDDDPAILDGLFKDTIRKNAALLMAAYDESNGGSIVPPVAVAEATRRNATALALVLIRKGTSTLGGLKECNRITELVCSPVGFAGEKEASTVNAAIEAALASGGALPSGDISRDQISRHYSLICRLHFRQLFIAEVIRHCAHLVNDALGSSLLQRTILLMVSGTSMVGLGEDGGLWYNVSSSCTGGDDSSNTNADAPSADAVPANANSAAAIVCPLLWSCTHQLALVVPPAAADKASSPSELLLLIDTLGSPTLPDAACHTHGTRAILKIAEVITTVEECEAFLGAIEGVSRRPSRAPADGSSSSSNGSASGGGLRLSSKFISLLIDMNGNSVLNKILTSTLFTEEGDDALTKGSGAPVSSATSLRRQVYGVIASKCLDVCRNRQGCCTIQRCIVSAPEPYKQQMVDVVLANALKLVQDPFGNYVIQFLLDGSAVNNAGGEKPAAGGGNNSKKQPSKYTNLIIRQLLHHIPTLSTNKFSSNVIEKCLKSATSDVKQLLIDELTEPQALPKLLVDSYANYVVQTAIEAAADEAQFKQLRDAITPLQHLLKNSPYGGKIETRLERRQRDMHSQKRLLLHQQQQQAASGAAAGQHNDGIKAFGGPGTGANNGNGNVGVSGNGNAKGGRGGHHKRGAAHLHHQSESGPVTMLPHQHHHQQQHQNHQPHHHNGVPPPMNGMHVHSGSGVMGPHHGVMGMGGGAGNAPPPMYQQQQQQSPPHYHQQQQSFGAPQMPNPRNHHHQQQQNPNSHGPNGTSGNVHGGYMGQPPFGGGGMVMGGSVGPNQMPGAHQQQQHAFGPNNHGGSGAAPPMTQQQLNAFLAAAQHQQQGNGPSAGGMPFYYQQ